MTPHSSNFPPMGADQHAPDSVGVLTRDGGGEDNIVGFRRLPDRRRGKRHWHKGGRIESADGVLKGRRERDRNR